jgi:hypothetical protein
MTNRSTNRKASELEPARGVSASFLPPTYRHEKVPCHGKVQPRLHCAYSNSSSVRKPRRIGHDMIRERHVNKPDGDAEMNSRRKRYHNHPKIALTSKHNIHCHTDHTSGACCCRRTQFVENNLSCNKKLRNKAECNNGGERRA